MGQYIHQTPGRIRLRSKALRCRSEKRARAAELVLSDMDGVQSIRVNPRAGSITIHYDIDRVRQSDLLAALEEVGCMAETSRGSDGASKVVDRFGKAIVGAVVSQAVERSARTLLTAFI